MLASFPHWTSWTWTLRVENLERGRFQIALEHELQTVECELRIKEKKARIDMRSALVLLSIRRSDMPFTTRIARSRRVFGPILTSDQSQKKISFSENAGFGYRAIPIIAKWTNQTPRCQTSVLQTQ